MSGHESQGGDDVRQQWARAILLVRHSLRKWWVVVLALVLGAAGCALFFALRVPSYRSETVLLYSQGINATDATATPASRPENTATRLREMLLSRRRLRAIIDEHRLYQETIDSYGYMDAVHEFREDITFRAPGSDTYTISFVGTSPDQARDVTAALSESLMTEEQFIRMKNAQITRDFIQKEAERAEQALKEAEQRLAVFLAKHTQFASDSMMLMGGNAAGAAIRAATAAEEAAPQQSPRTRTVWKSVTSTIESTPETPAELTAAKSRAESELHAAQATLTDRLSRYTRQHPDVRAAQGQVDRAKQQLVMAEAAIADALEKARGATTETVTRRPIQVPVAAATEKDGAKAIDEASSNLEQRLVQLETEWSLLMRDVSEARDRHGQLEASLFRADIAASSESGGQAVQFNVLDPAYLPARQEPPGPITIAGLFLVASLVLGGLAAVGAALMDDRLFEPLDVPPDIRLIATVPHVGK